MIYYRVALECDKCSSQFGKMRTSMTASDAPFVAGQLLDQALAAGWTSNGRHLCRKCTRRARPKTDPEPAIFASVRAPAVNRGIHGTCRQFDPQPDPRSLYTVKVQDAPGAPLRVIGTTKDERQAYDWELREHSKAGCATQIVDLLTGYVIFNRKAEWRPLARTAGAHA
jgi:hypothetical protein